MDWARVGLVLDIGGISYDVDNGSCARYRFKGRVPERSSQVLMT